MDDTVLTKRGGIRSRHGQSMVEFAMVVPLFFLLVFGIIDIGRIFYVEMTLQNALRQAGRFAVTGDNHYNGQATNRLDAIQLTAQQAAVGLIGNAGSIQVGVVTNSANGQYEVEWGNAGGPNDTVIVQLTVALQLFTPMIGQFFPNGSDSLSVSTAFKNEPF